MRKKKTAKKQRGGTRERLKGIKHNQQHFTAKRKVRRDLGILSDIPTDWVYSQEDLKGSSLRAVGNHLQTYPYKPGYRDKSKIAIGKLNLKSSDRVVVCLSGRGDKDLATYIRELDLGV